LDIVDKASGAGIVSEVEGVVDRYGFTHSLAQQTLYEELGASRRTRAHRKIADALERLCGDHPESRAGELARHYAAATKAADATKALSYSKMAGDQALVQLAPADALGWYTRALDLYGQVASDETLGCDLLIGLGTAQRQTGDPAHRKTFLEAAAIAKGLGDPDRLIAAALANNRGSVSEAGKVDLERVGVLENALDATVQGDSNDRALLLATLSAELMFSDHQRWSDSANEALAMARRLDDPLTFVRVTDVVYSNGLPDNLSDRLVDLAQALSMAEELSDPLATYRANVNRSVACLQAGDRAGFDYHLEAASAIGERIGEPAQHWAVATLRSVGALLAGDIEGAEELLDAAHAIGLGSVPDATVAYGSQLLHTGLVRGREDELVRLADVMAQAARDYPGVPALRSALANVYLQLGHKDEAHRVIDDDIGDAFSRYPYDNAWTSAMAFSSEVCVVLEECEAARQLYEWLLPWKTQLISNTIAVDGPVTLHLGNLATLLGEYDAAKSHFAESLGMSQNLRAPYWTARTQLDWSKMLLQRKGSGETDQAKATLESVLDTARRYGFTAVERRAGEALAALS